MDPYQKATAELADIDSRIAALQQRREVLRQFVDLADALYGQPAAQHALPKTMAALAMQSARENSAKARILAVCKAHVLAYGPTHTRGLLAAVEAAGIEISAMDKAGALSVILSKSVDFVSDRKVGWALLPEEKTPQGAPTPAGSGVGSSVAPAEGTGSAAG